MRSASATGEPMSNKVYVINGPNLNLLGLREPEIYGSDTLDDIASRLEDKGRELGIEVDVRQSNHEGHLCDWLHEAQAEGANPAAREAYRHKSYVAMAAKGTIAGFGAFGYELALEAAARL